MKIVLVFVSTLDGKITKWGDPRVRSWSSKNDKDHFSKIWKNARLIVMGSNTYNTDLFKPSPDHLLIVMTKNPLKYKIHEVSSRIEFTDETPEKLVERLEKKGYQQILLAGGAKVATSFLDAQLVDELWLTIEPKIFGKGDNFITEKKLDISLQLMECKKVNGQGTLITKYAVVKK